MKITSFDPVIVTPDADSVKQVFEDLGFEQKHAPTNTLANNQVTSYRMKHPGGYHVDVVSTSAEIAQDRMVIRMNVDDFEAAYKLLEKHGFKNTLGDQVHSVKSAMAATMESPSGFRISIVKHIKDHD